MEISCDTSMFIYYGEKAGNKEKNKFQCLAFGKIGYLESSSRSQGWKKNVSEPHRLFKDLSMMIIDVYVSISCLLYIHDFSSVVFFQSHPQAVISLPSSCFQGHDAPQLGFLPWMYPATLHFPGPRVRPRFSTKKAAAGDGQREWGTKSPTL